MRRDTFDPGRARHRITIYRRNVTGQSSHGEDTLGTPTVIATCYAEILALQGREMEAVQQTWTDARFKLTTQYVSGVLTSDYIVDNEGRTLDIVDVQDPTGMRAMLVMFCKRVN